MTIVLFLPQRQGSRARSIASLNAIEKEQIHADTSNSAQFSSAPVEISSASSRSSIDYSKRSTASAPRPRAPPPPAVARPRQISGRTRAPPAPVSQPVVRRAPAVPPRREPLKRRAVPPPPERIRSNGVQNAPSMPMAKRTAAAPRRPPGPLDRQSHSTPGNSRIR